METPAEQSPGHRPSPVEVGSEVRLTVAHLREQLTQALNRELQASGAPADTHHAEFVLTAGAIKVLRALSSAPGVPDGTGLRITRTKESAHGDALHAAMVSGPRANDRVITEAGVRVFVEADAEPHLSGKVLTAQIDASGHAQFFLRGQERRP